ncbi:arginine--tRNA ligase [Patescibacteria group bacterium]|nr:arginine--tRNA ligase [Patescibacteria group bacterium]
MEIMKEEIKELIRGVIVGLQKNRIFPEFEIPEIVIDCSTNKNNGDYSTGVVLKLGRYFSQEAAVTAITLKNRLAKSEIFSKVEVAGPGFINFFISPKYLHNKIKEVLKQKEKFGVINLGNNRKVNVEFISANPTGPLTLGNGRGGFGGDVLANVLEKAGYKVSREYYINDTGAQIKKLGHSVLGDAEAVYKGKYIDDLRKICTGIVPEQVGKKAGKIILEKTIKPSIKKMGIKFDKWFSETTLYKSGEVDKAIEELTKRGFTYESEGALWFKSMILGDDKDRVLIRADGIKTYFASDIAYLKNKFERGFEKLIIFLGADHYGYVARLKAASYALGFKKEDIEAIVLQLVKLFENGKEVRMSKRTGTYVAMDELIDAVGLDVARFFFLQRSLNTHFNFDMDIAKEKSDKNPVFKVQYAYARINSIFKKSKIKISKPKNLELLKEPSELELMKQIIRFTEIIEDIAEDYQLQRLSNYALELAESFYKFYENCKVITEDKKLTEARLSLLLAAKIVLEGALKLMGISAPEKM